MNMKSSPPINIKLIQGLSLISQKELSEFVFFSTSKYFSGQRSYSNILKILKALHKSGFKGHDNNSILGLLMKELELSKNTLQNRISELYKIFEMFIVIRELKYLPFERNRILMNYYSQKNSFKLFDYVYNSAFEFQKKEKVSSERMKRDYSLYDLSSTNYFFRGNSKSYTEHFSLKSDYQIYAFLIDLLKNGIEIHQQNFMSLKHNSRLPEKVIENLPVNVILKDLKKSNTQYYYLIMIVYEMYLSFGDYSVNRHFKNAVRIHKKIKASLSDDDNQFVYLLFITYCINQTHFEKPEFYKFLFNIISQKLKDGYYRELTENNFPVNNFRDYVFIGLKIGEVEWVRSFIKEYSHCLPPEYRKDDVLIAEGMVAVKERKFEKAIILLNKVRKKNYLHYTDSSFHKLRAYYQLEHYADALIEIERIKKYFKSNKNIPAIFLEKYSPYLKDIEILFKFSERKISRNDLNHYFEKPEKIISTNWVYEIVKKIRENN